MSMEEIKDRIKNKISEIEKYLEQLESILPSTFLEYQKVLAFYQHLKVLVCLGLLETSRTKVLDGYQEFLMLRILEAEILDNCKAVVHCLKAAVYNEFLYQNNFKIKLMEERSFEKIVWAVVDLAFIIIKEKNLKQPEEEDQISKILAKSNIISEELSKKLQDAKGMQNIIAHEYGKIDDELVFHSLTEELMSDINKFLKAINIVLK